MFQGQNTFLSILPHIFASPASVFSSVKLVLKGFLSDYVLPSEKQMTATHELKRESMANIRQLWNKSGQTHTVHHNEKWWQTMYILKAGINSKLPPLSMSHFPVISVLDWISTKAAKHLWGSRCVVKGIPLGWPSEHHILWVAMHLNGHINCFSQVIYAEGCCFVDRRGFSLTSIHHCSDLKLTVFLQSYKHK